MAHFLKLISAKIDNMPKNELKSTGWEHIGDKVKTRKLTKTARFDWKYVDLAARFIAAGYNIKDLAFLLGVEPGTVDKWRQRYPQFKKAVEEGQQIAVNQLVSKGLRAAGGYDYTEVKQEYEIVEKEVNGKLTPVKKLKKEVVQKKHKEPNAYLTTFFLMNLAPQYFKEVRKVEVENKHTVNVSVKESEAIKKLAGALADLSEEKTVDAEFEPIAEEKEKLEIS